MVNQQIEEDLNREDLNREDLNTEDLNREDLNREDLNRDDLNKPRDQDESTRQNTAYCYFIFYIYLVLYISFNQLESSKLYYARYNAHVTDNMFCQYKDLTKAGDCLRKLNSLTQTGSTRSLFRKAENLNLHAKLPEEAPWKTLKEGLNMSLQTSVANVRPAPRTYAQWKQIALELGPELDAINMIESAYKQRPPHDPERDDLKNHILKGNHKQRFTHGCFGCRSEGHNISDCPNKHNTE